MSFGFCCEHYHPSVGGVQVVMRQIAERLVSAGHNVTVLTSSHPNRAKDVLINGVRVMSFNVSGNRVQGIQGDVQAYRDALINGKYNAILIKAAQQWTFDAAIDVIDKIHARKIFIPCGFSGLHLNRYKEYYRKMAGWLQLFDKLIFYSKDYQDINYAKKNGLMNFKILSNGFDEREFEDLNSDNMRGRLCVGEKDFLILSVGSLIAAKGHWDVIKSFMKAKHDRKAVLVINGNNPKSGMLPQIKRFFRNVLSGKWPIEWVVLLNNFKADNKKILIVDLVREDLINLYKAADLFVLASHVEYSPLVLFEAAAASTTFICTDVGNCKEIAEWCGTGSVVSLGDHERFTEKITNMLADACRLKENGKIARKNVYKRGLTWKRLAEEYLEVLSDDISIANVRPN